MKIDLYSIDRSNFLVEENIILSNGETIFFVRPLKKPENLIWTKKNRIFRSSVWNSDGKLISASFPKFVNWGENEENFPTPKSLENCQLIEKIDGSLLIVSRYNGHIFYRTRSTLDAVSLGNGKEIDIFAATICPRINNWVYDNTWNMSFLFEWTSPNQRLVIDNGSVPNWRLVGTINHDDYSLIPQSSLDQLSPMLHCQRPKRFSFNNIDEMLREVGKWKGAEGIVVYSNEGQTLHKVKSTWYLALHRMKTETASLENLIKVWFQMGKPNYNEFITNIEKHFDPELILIIRGDISKICDAWKHVQEILEGFRKFIEVKLKPLGNFNDEAVKKEIVDVIVSSYGKTSRASFLFKIACGESLTDDNLEKLLYQCLKNKK